MVGRQKRQKANALLSVFCVFEKGRWVNSVKLNVQTPGLC